MIMFCRLCDLSKLSHKRRYTHSSDSSVPAKKNKRVHKNEGTNTETEDDLSSSDSVFQINTKGATQHDLGLELNEKMDHYWAQQIVKDLNESATEEIEEPENSVENNEQQKKTNEKKEKSADDLKKVSRFSKLV